MSVFVIFKEIEDDEVNNPIVGYKPTRKEAKLFCDTKNIIREEQMKRNEEINLKRQEYSKNLSNYLKSHTLYMTKVKKEYLRLLDKPKPDLSKVPQERHHILIQNYNNKIGNRLKELEQFMLMNQLEIENYNQNVYEEAKKKYGDCPEYSKIECNEKYYYWEAKELP